MTVTEKVTGNLLAGVGYSSSEKFVFNASISQQNIFGSGNALTAGINTSCVNRTIAVTFTEPYYTVRRRLAHARGLPAQPRPLVASVAPYSSLDAGRGGQLRHPDHRDRHHQPRLPLRAHRADAVRRTARSTTSCTSRSSASSPTASSSAPGGRVTPETTSSILRGGCSRRAGSKWGFPSSTFRITRRIT